MYNYSEASLPEVPLTQFNDIIHSTLYVYIAFVTMFLLIIFGGLIYLVLSMDSGYHLCNCCRDSHCVITTDQECNVETQV